VAETAVFGLAKRKQENGLASSQPVFFRAEIIAPEGKW
jgi:hypothetical protein